MIAVESKAENQILHGKWYGVYRAPNEDMQAIEILVARTGFTGNYKTLHHRW
jgi:hypothetical protein